LQGRAAGGEDTLVRWWGRLGVGDGRSWQWRDFVMVSFPPWSQSDLGRRQLDMKNILTGGRKPGSFINLQVL